MSGEPLLTWLNALLMRLARISLGVSFSIDSNPAPLLLSAFPWERLRLGLGFIFHLVIEQYPCPRFLASDTHPFDWFKLPRLCVSDQTNCSNAYPKGNNDLEIERDYAC